MAFLGSSERSISTSSIVFGLKFDNQKVVKLSSRFTGRIFELAINNGVLHRKMWETLCKENDENHEKNDHGGENFDHEPAVGGDRAEVLEQLGVRSLNVQLGLFHICIDSHYAFFLL